MNATIADRILANLDTLTPISETVIAVALNLPAATVRAELESLRSELKTVDIGSTTWIRIPSAAEVRPAQIAYRDANVTTDSEGRPFVRSSVTAERAAAIMANAARRNAAARR